MSNEKANILIVDDKVSNLFALEEILTRPGRNFIRAINGKDALRMVLNKDIDLIILDVQMPGMDGFEVANILKSNRRSKDIPIIFASAEKKEHRFILQGFGEGAVDYLYKPLDAEITEAKVAVLLQLHTQKKELARKNATLERYALLINNSADLICIINAHTLKFLEVNDAVNAMLGYTVEEMKGSSFAFYLSREDRPLLEQLSKENKDTFSFETRVYSKDRMIKWLHWNIVSKNDLWFANARDITGIKEAEEIRNHLAIVVKQSNDAIYLHNHDGKIISWNEGAEKIYGFTEAEALNMKIWNIVPDHAMQEMQEVINGILKGERIQSMEMKRITKYGKMIDVVFSASVITDPNDNLKSVAITERDITAQKKSDQEIQQLNNELTRHIDELQVINQEMESFSYSVSHDLRAPIRCINGYSHIILDAYREHFDEELNRLFGIILENSKKMGALVDDLLAFSRLGKRGLSKGRIDIDEVAHRVVTDIGVAGARLNARINIGPLKPTEGDQTLLYQVFMNLVSNAIKYSGKKENPVIDIGCTEQGNEYIYYVKDNGSGFNMKHAHKLFGVFQRLHNNNEFEGTGVGLAIVQRIVAKHGGRVWAESVEGEGATFYFSLPAPVKP